jgi:hypothetical protein
MAASVRGIGNLPLKAEDMALWIIKVDKVK